MISAGALAADPNTELDGLESRVGGGIGVAAIETRSSREVKHRSDQRFPMCSTFKLLATAAVLKRVDQGRERLDRFVPYTAKDLLEYAPVTRLHLKEGGMKVGDLCAAAIEQSDNTAANLLLASLRGPQAVTEFARTLGDQVTRLDRIEPELNNWAPGDDRDTTTPAAMVGDLKRVLSGDVLSSRSRDQLESWLEQNQTGAGMIRASVPAGWKIGDKTGRGANGATNDVAILRSPSGETIFLAIYTVGSSKTPDERAGTVAKVAKLTLDALTK